jgi:hypothetical protein
MGLMMMDGHISSDAQTVVGLLDSHGLWDTGFFFHVLPFRVKRFPLKQAMWVGVFSFFISAYSTSSS